MSSLLSHAALGVVTVIVFFYANAHLYRRDWSGSRTTILEGRPKASTSPRRTASFSP
ncbi:MAG: hypothetical protein WAU39_20085 [Polyangiales bacterium]